MKENLKQLVRRGVAVMMSVFTAMSVVPTSTVLAASEKATITLGYCYDSQGNTIKYQQTYKHNGITCAHVGESYERIYADGDDAYCIQPGAALNTGSTLQAKASDTWNALSKEQQDAVNLALLYGAQGNLSNLSGTADEKSIATQLIVWEIVTQCRSASAPYNRTDSKFYTGICAGGANSGVAKVYEEIVQGMQQHGTIPSFAFSVGNSSAKELGWDGEQYVLQLKDENGVLSKFDFTSSNSKVNVSASGNTLTITSKEAITEEVMLTATKKIPTVSSSAKLVAYGDASLQDVVTGVENTAAVKAYLNVKIPYGHVNIVKTSEDGIVEGIRFQITGNGIDKTVITGTDGSIKVENLQPGTYTVTEITEDRYEDQKEQKVTVIGGETAKVEFSNVLKRGDLKVTKSSEDGLVEGVKFHLYGTSLSGASVDEYATTDGNGIATFKDILISGNKPYTLEEVETAVKYVVPAGQSVTVKWNEVTNTTVTNILKKFRVTVEKTDAEKGTAQGNATLAGAVYGIYKGEELIDTYTTDADGRFASTYYICGDDWSIREISPSEGYQLDERIHHVGAEAKNYTVERNTASNDVTEQVIKGRVSIIKHTDDGSTQIETPEEGAEFQIYLKSAGNYEGVKDSEKDTLVCDEYGYAESKDLPYGVYTVHQTKSWEGRELVDDFDVYISSNGEVYRYIINNRMFESYIKVVKKDAETGNVIPLEGAGFQIYDEAGNLVTMQYTYPEVTKIDTFYTGKDGYLITPEDLSYGNYTLVEVQAPYGYVLDSTPIPFTVTKDNSAEEDGVTLVVVEKQDMPQKGKIQVQKTGEEFTTVTVSGDEKKLYTPVYEVKGKAGAVYEIIALEDIATGDGTVRAKAGEVVDTVTTGEDGIATSKELYLGKYKVVEKTAPDGLVLNMEEHVVELVYAGQEVSVTSANTAYYNERQKVMIDLVKRMETDETFGIGNNGEIQNVAFGLFAAEDIVATDGSVIPADGILEVLSCDAEGRITFTSDLPFGKYYVQEIQTNEHYHISDTKYLVEFAYQGQDTALVTIHVNDGEAISNELIYGRIEGIKVDTEEKALEGAVIGLFAVDTVEFNAETAILTSTSDADGAFSFENVPYGSYVIREMESPEGYVLNEALHYVAITENEEVIKVKVYNKPITGKLELTKKDVSDGKLLPNAGFRIKDEAGNIVATGTTDENGLATFTLRYGKYTYQEYDAPEGYLIDESEFPFEIKEDGQIVKATMTNEKESTEKITTPTTGDVSKAGIWVGLAGVSAAGLGMFGYFLRRKKK